MNETRKITAGNQSISDGRRGWRRHWKVYATAFSGFLLILVLGFYFSLPDVSYLKSHHPRRTRLMEIRIRQAKEEGKRYRIRQYWVSFGRIPRLLKQSVRISEDASFYFHNGVDFTELKESIKKNLAKGRFARGGSTITQQLAKNLYLSPEKTILRKVREFFIARRLESTLSKNRIFHLYLNVIELGRGIFGVQAAARYYFGKNVQDLNLEEIARLTAIIPRPLTVRPTGRSRWLRWRCRWILRKLLRYRYITREQYDQTIAAFR